MCFLRYLLQASCVCSWCWWLTAFIASTLSAEQGMCQYLYFCFLSSLLKAFLFISILSVCVEIIIQEHAVQIKRKILPCSNYKGFETLPGSWCQLKDWLWQCRNDASVDFGGWGQPGLEPQNQRVGVTTQALAYLLCLDPVIWISELFQKSCYTVFCLPAVPGCCNLNFKTVSHNFLVHKCAEPLCWEPCAFPWCWAAGQPLSLPPMYWLNTALHITANGWSSSCGAFLHGWLLFYVNNWQHAPCLNPTGTCQVTFSLRFNVLSELTKCSVLGVRETEHGNWCCVALTK